MAGCVGNIDTGAKRSGKGGEVDPPGYGGSTGITGPSACKEDQIGISPLRRLTRTQYDNSIKDLLGVDLGLSQHFSEDELAGPFAGNYFTPISESQYTQYATAAATAAFKTVERLAQLLPCAAAGGDDACAGQFIRQFGRRAYRRPLTGEEIALLESVYAQGGDFATGIRLVIAGLLQSPKFLYL
ncbi:MAG TPA: DUF1595 domain-containing protein, partial [Polyangia bacterium]|nr:DUF1595 domain-containing protein [Polyangia bacterium]